MRKELPAVVGLIALAGCVNTSQLPDAPPIPEPVRAQNLAPYYLQPGDVLDIRLMLNPELNEEVTVRPDGRISTTVVPDEVAAGRTVAELADSLRRDYRRDLQNPRVTILVKSIAPWNVYVGGEVQSPGLFTTNGGAPISLSQALARSGGVRFSGDTDAIFIIRRNATNLNPTFYKVNYAAVTGAHDPTKDVLLAPNDIVYVPRTGIADVYAAYNQWIEQFAHPSFSFNYLVAPQTSGGSVVSTPTTPVVTPTR